MARLDMIEALATTVQAGAGPQLDSRLFPVAHEGWPIESHRATRAVASTRGSAPRRRTGCHVGHTVDFVVKRLPKGNKAPTTCNVPYLAAAPALSTQGLIFRGLPGELEFGRAPGLPWFSFLPDVASCPARNATNRGVHGLQWIRGNPLYLPGSPSQHLDDQVIKNGVPMAAGQETALSVS